MACKHIIKVMNPDICLKGACSFVSNNNLKRNKRQFLDHCTHIISASRMSVVSLRFRLYGLLLPLYMSIGLYRVYTVFINNLYLHFRRAISSWTGMGFYGDFDRPPNTNIKSTTNFGNKTRSIVVSLTTKCSHN